MIISGRPPAWESIQLFRGGWRAEGPEASDIDPLETREWLESIDAVLRVHGPDILRFQPDFLWDGAAPDRSAYLVQRGDETVGVVLIRDAGDGVAQVELDYVTPRFRDFSPGEFVWRQSGVLKDDGFRRVVTPSGMVAPYYDKVGFHKEDDVFVLDL